jgi:hypothetical protein
VCSERCLLGGGQHERREVASYYSRWDGIGWLPPRPHVTVAKARPVCEWLRRASGGRWIRCVGRVRVVAVRSKSAVLAVLFHRRGFGPRAANVRTCHYLLYCVPLPMVLSLVGSRGRYV